MHVHSVDYREREGHSARALINRGWWVNGLPRLMPMCRLFGHVPVVDGTGAPGEHRGYVSRWVVCDRCGVRPDPQGRLDPEKWNVGERYTGPLRSSAEPETPEMPAAERILSRLKTVSNMPGPWPSQPTGEIGGQVVIGRGIGGAGAEFKVGNAGSEHVLATHAHLNPVGFIAVHTEGFGQGIQRRLNPVGYDSRVIEVSVSHGRLTWKVWAKRDEWKRGTPKWQDGSVRIDPRDVLLGGRRYTYEPVKGPVDATVRMPEGDDHTVALTLQRCRLARPRGGRAVMSWDVAWESQSGIPHRNHDWKGDNVYGSSVKVSDAAVEADRWAEAACAAIAASISQDRTRYRWRPSVATTEES